MLAIFQEIKQILQLLNIIVCQHLRECFGIWQNYCDFDQSNIKMSIFHYISEKSENICRNVAGNLLKMRAKKSMFEIRWY